MNTQPYKVVVIRTPDEKKRLGKHMLLNNEKFVNTASATLIVCCDLGILFLFHHYLLEPTKDLHELTQLELDNGASPESAGIAEKFRKFKLITL